MTEEMLQNIFKLCFLIMGWVLVYIIEPWIKAKVEEVETSNRGEQRTQIYSLIYSAVRAATQDPEVKDKAGVIKKDYVFRIADTLRTKLGADWCTDDWINAEIEATYKCLKEIEGEK